MLTQSEKFVTPIQQGGTTLSGINISPFHFIHLHTLLSFVPFLRNLTLQHSVIMGRATMAERELIIKKMDAQFESDLKMRKDTTACNKRAIDATKNLSLLQKVFLV